MVAKCRHRDHCGTVWHHPQNRNYMRNHNAARGTTAAGNIWWQFYHHWGQQLQIWWSSHMWLQRYVSIQTHGLAYHYTFAPLTGQNCSSCCVVLCAVSLSAHSVVVYCYMYVLRCAVCRDGAAQAVRDGCRFHGSLTVNKVAGNFHITAGKYVATHMHFYWLLVLTLFSKQWSVLPLLSCRQLCGECWCQ